MRTYGELEKELGSGSRAVGHACGANPMPIISPCHRVLAANGKIDGFTDGDGATTIKKLLNYKSVYTL
jgi:methylated-DNA-[protein]-cysteine S-methyltransferase